VLYNGKSDAEIEDALTGFIVAALHVLIIIVCVCIRYAVQTDSFGPIKQRQTVANED
jgi:hypothetical protein